MKDVVKARTIHQKHIPPKFPLASTVMWLTAAHYWKIPEWSWGVLFCLVACVWIYWIAWSCTHEAIEFDADVTEVGDAPKAEAAKWAKQTAK